MNHLRGIRHTAMNYARCGFCLYWLVSYIKGDPQ